MQTLFVFLINRSSAFYLGGVNSILLVEGCRYEIEDDALQMVHYYDMYITVNH